MSSPLPAPGTGTPIYTVRELVERIRQDERDAIAEHRGTPKGRAMRVVGETLLDLLPNVYGHRLHDERANLEGTALGDDATAVIMALSEAGLIAAATVSTQGSETTEPVDEPALTYDGTRLPPAIGPDGTAVDHDCDFRRMLRQFSVMLNVEASPRGGFDSWALRDAVVRAQRALHADLSRPVPASSGGTAADMGGLVETLLGMCDEADELAAAATAHDLVDRTPYLTIREIRAALTPPRSPQEEDR